MTEDWWNVSNDAQRMYTEHCQKLSDRKKRLFACALYRIGYEQYESRLDAVEEWADGGPCPSTGMWLLVELTAAEAADLYLRIVVKPEAADALRDIAGDAPQVHPSSDALRIAKSIYASRDFASFPVLADALEDGGCGDHKLLRHLRGERCDGCDGRRTQMLCPVCHRLQPGDVCVHCERFLRIETKPVPCAHCNETGRTMQRHYRGCWALDAVLGYA